MGQANFIKFDGIDGESANKDHKGEIEVLTWSWGVEATAPTAGGSGSAVSKPVASPFHFLHNYDKASPLLARACAQGKTIKLVVLTARKSGEGQKDFLKVTLKDVMVTSVAVSAYDSMSESVALTPRAIAFEYSPQDPRGTLGTPVSFSWNLATGVIK